MPLVNLYLNKKELELVNTFPGETYSEKVKALMENYRKQLIEIEAKK